MGFHSAIYTNKQLRQLLSGYDLSKLQLISIVGKLARTKNEIKIKGNVITVFGSDFVAKVAIVERIVK